MTITVDVQKVQAQFDWLLRRVSEGHEIIITRADNPVARLVPFTEPVVERLPGSAKGLIVLAPDFDDPLSEDILAAFER